MADTICILENCEVLSTNVNVWEKSKDDVRTFMTAFCHIEGDEEGREKSSVFELNCEDPVAFEDLKKMRRKGPTSLVAAMRQFKDNKRYIYLDTVQSYFKPGKTA